MGTGIDTMVIPAAGYGVRMREITGGSSKELLEVNGQPILLYALQEAVNAGLRRVIVVIRRAKRDIQNMLLHDPRSSELCQKLQIDIAFQDYPSGEAGAIAAAAHLLKQSWFIVHYPDNIATPGRSGYVAELIVNQSFLGTDTVLLTSWRQGAQGPLCPLQDIGNDLYRISSASSAHTDQYYLRPTGIYIASPDFLGTCVKLVAERTNCEIKDLDVRQVLISEGLIIHALDLLLPIFDVGNPIGLMLARKQFKKMPTNVN